jgi:DNA-binding response OmpR family regulator
LVKGLVLVVDDDEDIRLITLAQILRERDFRVQVAFNGLNALEKILEEEPDLVILDLMMPVLNGQEVLRVLCNSRPDLPVLVHSAVALSAANAELVPKPVSVERLDQLLEKVEERVKERRARRDARSSVCP